MNVKIGRYEGLIILALLVVMLIGARMMAPSGQAVINNDSNCTVEMWPAQSAQGATLMGDYRLVHDAVPPYTRDRKVTINANDQWANFMADCPGNPVTPLTSVHLYGPPEKDFTVNVSRDAKGTLQVQADEIGGYYKWKKPLDRVAW